MRFKIGLIAILGLLLSVDAGQPAFAQDKPKTLMELLFPRNNEKPQAKPAAKPKAQPAKPKKRITAKRNAAPNRNAPASLLAAPPAAPIIEKSATAKKVLVIGDFLASGTAAGLAATFEQSADTIIVDASNGSSGLVRDDFYNWPSEVGNLITAQQPSIVVVMLGANDRQPLTINGKREEVRSPAWLTEYQSRVNQLATAVTSRNIPLVWIGQVPFRSSTMTADMLALNDIFRDVADNDRARASYIDVWEGFVDETGKFMERGPDVNGQNVALRTGQVNVTKAGYRKIAFYAEQNLKRLLGETLNPNAGPIIDANLPPLTPGPLGIDPNLERLRPVDLLGAALTNSETLMGATVQPSLLTPPATVSPVPDGRIDNLRPMR